MWTVTRQHQFPDGNFVVEISQGGFDYCNPDCLGKAQEFQSPVEAVKAAIEIAQVWDRNTEEPVYIGMGATGGMTMPFDPEELTEETFSVLLSQAQAIEDAMPKCDRCGKLIEKEYRRMDDWTGERFCSEFCVEEAVQFEEEESNRLDAMEEEMEDY